MYRVARRFLEEIRKATSLQSYDVRQELVLWDFKQLESLREWNVIRDRDVGGYSSASLEPNGKGTTRVVDMLYSCTLRCRNGSQVSRLPEHGTTAGCISAL